MTCVVLDAVPNILDPEETADNDLCQKPSPGNLQLFAHKKRLLTECFRHWSSSGVSALLHLQQLLVGEVWIQSSTHSGHLEQKDHIAGLSTNCQIEYLEHFYGLQEHMPLFRTRDNGLLHWNLHYSACSMYMPEKEPRCNALYSACALPNKYITKKPT